jgi:hypothetical protein
VTRALLTGVSAALCALALASPASAARSQVYGFSITDARISEVMTFQGDNGPACQRVGVCGYSGTVTYGFDHADGLMAAEVTRGHAVGFGFLSFNGLTSATVQAPGGGPPCTDKVIRKFDAFQVKGGASRLRFVFHPSLAGPNFLDTYCTGPRDGDIARAIPTLAVPVSQMKRRTLLLHLSGTRPFHAGPFQGTLAFSADLRMRRSRQLLRLFQQIPLG